MSRTTLNALILVALILGCAADAPSRYAVPVAFADMVGAYRTLSVEPVVAAVVVTGLDMQIIEGNAEAWTLSYRLAANNSLNSDVSLTATIWWRARDDATLAISTTEGQLIPAGSHASVEGVVVISTMLAEQLDPARTRMEWTWRGVNQ